MWGNVAHVEKCVHFFKENPKRKNHLQTYKLKRKSEHGQHIIPNYNTSYFVLFIVTGFS
jgi:hypothetical protein